MDAWPFTPAFLFTILTLNAEYLCYEKKCLSFTVPRVVVYKLKIVLEINVL